MNLKFQETENLEKKICILTKKIGEKLKTDELTTGVLQKIFALQLFKKNNLIIPEKLDKLIIDEKSTEKCKIGEKNVKEIKNLNLKNLDLNNLNLKSDVSMPTTPSTIDQSLLNISTASTGLPFNNIERKLNNDTRLPNVKNISTKEIDRFMQQGLLTVIIIYYYDTEPPFKGYKYAYSKQDEKNNKKMCISAKQERKNLLKKTLILKSLESVYGKILDKKINIITTKDFVNEMYDVIVQKESSYLDESLHLYYIDNYSSESINESNWLKKIDDTKFKSTTSSLNTSIQLE
uniref:Uncharacterized protein n=1 Tax=Strongyloides papillosus TaxID=174720 RepID=A0A0N5BBW9_STREA